MIPKPRPAMFEVIVLLVGATPFLLGLYALKMIKKGDDSGSDDQPPPPDPGPPRPVVPPAPRTRREHTPVFHRHERRPVDKGWINVPGRVRSTSR